MDHQLDYYSRNLIRLDLLRSNMYVRSLTFCLSRLMSMSLICFYFLTLLLVIKIIKEIVCEFILQFIACDCYIMVRHYVKTEGENVHKLLRIMYHEKFIKQLCYNYITN